MASLFISSSFSTVSRTLSASHMVRSYFSSISKSFAIMGIWQRFAFRSPRSILLYIGVSISNAADSCRCSRPCSSLSSFIFFPNIISLPFLLIEENETISHHKMIEGIIIGNLLQREIGVKDVAYLQ